MADLLEIDVLNHSELTRASKSGSSKPRDFIFHDVETIFFPYAGILKIAEKTVSTVREKITQGLDEFVDKGRATLAEVIATASPINPEISNPGRIYVIHRNLMELIIFWFKNRMASHNDLSQKFFDTTFSYCSLKSHALGSFYSPTTSTSLFIRV